MKVRGNDKVSQVGGEGELLGRMIRNAQKQCGEKNVIDV